MKKLTTKLMIVAAVFVAAAGTAAAQTLTLTASIPFEFRVGNRVMEAGTYQVEHLSKETGAPIFGLMNVNSHRRAILALPSAGDPQKAWQAEGTPKLAFACTGGRCVLAELWDGPGNYAYTFHSPKRGGGEDASLRVIPMQRVKGE